MRKKQDKTLDEIIQFVERKESGKRSAGQLLQSQGAEAARSQYRKAKNNEPNNTIARPLQPTPLDKNEHCNYCGKQGHGKNAPPRTRKTTCPAYGKTCDECGRLNHFKSLCRSKDKPKLQPTPNTPTAESAILDNQNPETYTNLETNNLICNLSLDHHQYNQLNNLWAKQASQKQPCITQSNSLPRGLSKSRNHTHNDHPQ